VWQAMAVQTEVMKPRTLTIAPGAQRFQIAAISHFYGSPALSISVLLILGGHHVWLIAGRVGRRSGGVRPFVNVYPRDGRVADQPVLGAAGPIYGTLVTSVIAMVIAIPVGIGIATFSPSFAPMARRDDRPLTVEFASRHIHSIISGSGDSRARPFMPTAVSIHDPAVRRGRPAAGIRFCAGPPSYLSRSNAALILEDHWAAVPSPDVGSHVVQDVPPVLKEAAYGVGCTTWEVVRKRGDFPYTRVE